MKLSVIIPVCNEAGNIKELYRQIKAALKPFAGEYEIIAIDDGSRDDSWSVLKDFAQQDDTFRAVHFWRNFGQTAAISAGIDLSQGQVIVPVDADLQNDPADILRLARELEQGFDVISGWRKKRRDDFFARKIPSWIANSLISWITGLKLHDYGCTLKAYRREIIKDVRFYGEMHRFMPAYAFWYGARVKEMEVNHRPRICGQTKYGISRTFRVILDLLTVKFLTKYSARPMHFFGYVGYWLLLVGFLSGLLALYLRFFVDMSFITTPLPLLTVFLILVGLQFILMGLLAEILVRIYFETRNKPSYLIKEKINFT